MANTIADFRLQNADLCNQIFLVFVKSTILNLQSAMEIVICVSID